MPRRAGTLPFMDILGHRPFGTDAASFDPDLRAAVGEEGDRVGQAASALLPPGESLHLTYATDYPTGRGSLQ